MSRSPKWWNSSKVLRCTLELTQNKWRFWLYFTLCSSKNLETLKVWNWRASKRSAFLWRIRIPLWLQMSISRFKARRNQPTAETKLISDILKYRISFPSCMERTSKALTTNLWSPITKSFLKSTSSVSRNFSNYVRVIRKVHLIPFQLQSPSPKIQIFRTKNSPFFLRTKSKPRKNPELTILWNSLSKKQEKISRWYLPRRIKLTT